MVVMDRRKQGDEKRVKSDWRCYLILLVVVDEEDHDRKKARGRREEKVMEN